MNLLGFSNRCLVQSRLALGLSIFILSSLLLRRKLGKEGWAKSHGKMISTRKRASFGEKLIVSRINNMNMQQKFAKLLNNIKEPKHIIYVDSPIVFLGSSYKTPHLSVVSTVWRAINNT